MKRPPEPEFVAFIGIDWADAKHDVCLQPANASEREFSVIVHRPEAIEAWAQELKRRFPGGSIAVCLELTQGPLVSALAKYDFLALFPVNPSTLAKYRQAFTPSHAKDDPTDAELQLELLLHHPDKLKRLDPPSRAMRTLQHLVEQRRGLVDDRRRITNQITCALKQYFPQALDWFQERDTVLFCDFLERWPALKQVKHARKATLEAFFREHNVRYPQVIEKRIRAIKTALALTEDLAVIRPHQLLARALVDQLRVSLKAIARRLRRTARSLPGRRSCAEILRYRARHRAQRQKTLGALATAVSEILAPDVRRMGRRDHSSLVLGRRLLSTTTRQGMFPSSRPASVGLQVGPDPLSLLADPHTLRRVHLSECVEASRLPTTQFNRATHLKCLTVALRA